jgi:hypothetical protein
MHAQARMRVYARFSLVPSNLCCYSETTEDWQETKHTHIPLHLIIYLVDHAIRKPPRLANLLEKGIIRQNSSITQVMQEEVDQVITLLPTCNNLSANISRIVNRRRMHND